MGRLSTEIHEANHAATALWIGRTVNYVERAAGHVFAGEDLGFCHCPIGDRLDGTQIAICISGRMGLPDWPPPFEQACVEPREGLNLVIERLGLTEEAYDGIVAVVREIHEDPDYQALRDVIAKALVVVPRLEAEDINRLAAALVIPIPEEQKELARAA